MPTDEHLQSGSVIFGGLDPNRLTRHGYSFAPFGSEPVWETGRWRQSIAESRSLRTQIQRARSRGIECQVEPAAPGLLMEMEMCRESWMRRLGQPHFRHDREYSVESASQHGAIITARQGGRLDAWLICMPLSEGKTLLAPICRSQSAGQGAVELLVDAAMRHAHREGFAEASMGVIPFAESALSQCPPRLRALMQIAKHRNIGYRYRGVEAFRSRLRPSRWQTRWIAWPQTLSVLSAGNAFAEMLYGERLTLTFALQLAVLGGS